MNATDTQTWIVCTGNRYARGIQIEARTSLEAAEQAIPAINAGGYSMRTYAGFKCKSKNKIAPGETVTFTVYPLGGMPHDPGGGTHTVTSPHGASARVRTLQAERDQMLAALEGVVNTPLGERCSVAVLLAAQQAIGTHTVTVTQTAERTRLNDLARFLLSRPLDRQRMSDWESEPKDLGSLVLKTISAYPARFTVDGLYRYLSETGGMPYDLGQCIEWLDADLGALRFSHDGRLSISPTVTA